jgi:predicted transposase YdaD
MRRKNDILWKGIMEIVFEDFLRFVYPDADRLFDWEKGFEFLDKELGEMYPEPEKKTATCFVDKLVRMTLRDGSETLFLLHVEVQGETKKQNQFAERMFRYFYRIFDRYRKPVTSIAIFTGSDGKRLPNTFTYEFLGTRLTYQYNALRILDYGDEELAKSDNHFALTMLAAKQALLKGRDLDEKLLKGKLFVFRKLYEKGIFGRQKMEAILSFLGNYVKFEKPETYCKFEEEVGKITGKRNTMDIFEQVAEMRKEEGKREMTRKFVENLLVNTRHSIQKIAELADVKVSFVKRVKKEKQAK